MEQIKDGDSVLALVLRANDWKEGLTFVSSDSDFQQVGTWSYPKGKQLLAHRHLLAPRTTQWTQEVVHVKQGALRATIYSTTNKMFSTVELGAGDTIVLLAGGHGYEILEDGTQVLEVKNGPYVGADKDRERI